MASASNNTSGLGIGAVGVYVPRLRMQRAAIAQAHRWMNPGLRGKGTRAYPSWDEDVVTMAVEAGRHALAFAGAATPNHVTVASTTFPFADLQNSSLVASALSLGRAVSALDVGGSQRCATSALLRGLGSGEPTLIVASEIVPAKPGGAQEMQAGAGAAALLLTRQNVIAEIIGSATRTEPFVDHFREAGSKFDYAWEERWVRDEGFMQRVPEAITAALKSAGVSAAEVKHFILATTIGGTAAAVAKKSGIASEAIAASQMDTIGHAGAAAPFISLAQVLENAQPGAVIVLVGFGQGVDVVVLRTTERLSEARSAIGFARAIGDRIEDDAYLRMLSFQDNIELEWGMRAEKDVKTALTEQHRAQPQVGAFIAGKCGRCGTVQFPQLSYCVNTACAAPAAEFSDVPLADKTARVVTYTADWLSYHPAPPLYVGFVQFESGARVLMEMVDTGPKGVEVGTSVRMVYRIKDRDRVRNYRRYFWKATPVTVIE